MRCHRQSPGGGDDDRGVEFATRQAARDDGLHALDRVVGEQLQHADVVSGADARSEPCFEGSTRTSANAAGSCQSRYTGA